MSVSSQKSAVLAISNKTVPKVSSATARRSSSGIPVLLTAEPAKRGAFLRRQSQPATKQLRFEEKLREDFKRRSYSLKDKSSIMTSSVYIQEEELKDVSAPASSIADENIPEKDVAVTTTTAPMETTEGGRQESSLLLSNCSTRDSLENLKFLTYSKDTDDTETMIKVVEVPEKKSQTTPRPQRTFNRDRQVHSSGGGGSGPKTAVLDPGAAAEEMRRQYESEIALLRRQLQQTQAATGVQPQAGEDALLKKNAALEAQLRKSQNEAENLQEQVHGMRVQLQTWPSKIGELEEENSSLRGRIEDVRTINQQRQNEIDELHEIVKNLETKLWEQSTGSQQQEKMFLQRLMHEYDNLLKDYELIKLTSLTNERKLYETRNRFNELNSRISELEMSLRKVEGENSFLRRRINGEKSFANSNYRGWSRSTYPSPMSGYQEEFRYRNGSSQELLNQYQRQSEVGGVGDCSGMGLMSMSCYGALPSFSPSSPAPQQRPVASTMSQSLYGSPAQPVTVSTGFIQPASGTSSQVATPTLEKRHITLQNDFKKATTSGIKRDIVSFEGEDADRGSSQSMVNSMNEIGFRSSGIMTSSMTNQQQQQQQSQLRGGSRKQAEMCSSDPWNLCRTDDDREIEKQYDMLQNEKRQLMTQLSHIPNSSSARNRRTNREHKENLEAKLDQIDRQLGLIRMKMKQKNIL